MSLKRNILLILLVLAISLFFLITFFKLSTSGYLSFSDGAKFALIAKNLVLGNGFTTIFSFWGKPFFSTGGVPLLIPYVMSLFFRIFDSTDFSVIAFSSFFYLGLTVLVFLLGKKLFGNLVGFLSAVAVAANTSYLNYATSGASETLFTFLAVLSAYLLVIKKRWTDILFFISLTTLYLTRPQGVVFISALLLSWFIYNFEWRKGIAYFAVLTLGLLLIDKYVLYPLSFKYPVYPIVIRGIQALFQYSPTTAVSDALRGSSSGIVTTSEVIKKTFYNLYNFYKLIPDIISPYMWGLFVIGIFMWAKNKTRRIFNLLAILAVFGTFLLTALTIPFYRYLHPVIPFVYLIAINTLVLIMNKLITNKKIAFGASVILVLFFTVGQTLGTIFLDSRFERNGFNVGKPPVYVVLSRILRDNTNGNQVVITNLDTWGSWYGDSQTIWFPLEPKQLIDPTSGKIPFDAIYLTSYKTNDENYYMGDHWRQIFESPTDSKKWICDGCSEIAKEFELKRTFKVTSDQDYERQVASAILLVRK